MTMAKKTNTPDGWFAWIQILNVSDEYAGIAAIGGSRTEIDQSTRREYLLRLIESVLARIMKAGGND